MTTWILVIWMSTYGGGGGITTQEFNNKQACLVAKQHIIAQKLGRIHGTHATCVNKGR